MAELRLYARRALREYQFRMAQCVGKARYSTWAEAHAAIRRDHSGVLDIYRCEFCSSYHVGKKIIRRVTWHREV